MRKHKIVTIDNEGRDKGKSFLVIEKPSYEAELWGIRAMLALGRAGVEVPDEVMQAGAMGLLAIGMQAFQKMAFEDAQPLLAEMMPCISYVPDVTRADPMTGKPYTRPLQHPTDANDGDIEEVSTILKLRGEVLELHLGFSVAAILSNLAAMAAARSSSQSDTPTSPRPAPRSSQSAKPRSRKPKASTA